MNKKTDVTCLNCQRNVRGFYCAYCGQKVKPIRLDFEWLIEEALDVTSHVAPHRIIRTIGAMLVHPGKTIFEYIEGHRIIYQQPPAYLVVGYGTYFLSAKYFLHGDHWVAGTLHNTNQLEMALSLFIIAAVTYLFLGRPKLNFIETIVAICYVYGTAFMLAPFIMLFQVPFAPVVARIDTAYKPLLVDIPLILICIYISISFCIAANIKLWRLLAPVLLSIAFGVFGSGILWTEH